MSDRHDKFAVRRCGVGQHLSPFPFIRKEIHYVRYVIELESKYGIPWPGSSHTLFLCSYLKYSNIAAFDVTRDNYV